MIANWNGHYLIIITHNGEDTPPIKVEMSKITEGRAFFKAVARLLEKNELA
jgi:ABC-type molybdenum transport system ATPase subunit/photorepair protein PhrA